MRLSFSLLAIGLILIGVIGCKKEVEPPPPPPEHARHEPRWLVVIHVESPFDFDTTKIDVADWKPGEDIVILEQLETDWRFWFYYPWQGEDTIRYSVEYKYEDYGFGGKGLWVNGKLMGMVLGSVDFVYKYNIPHPEDILTITSNNANNFISWVQDTDPKVHFPNLKVVMIDISSPAFQHYPNLVSALKALPDHIQICLWINLYYWGVFVEDGKNYDVTDCQLEELTELNNLRELRLRSTKITDTGVRSLSKCSDLRVLTLYGNRFTDKGIKALSHLDNLRELIVISSRITTRAMEYISSMKNLRSLTLNCERVTGRGLQFLRGMQNLEEVGLFNAKVSDADLENLIYLPNLRRFSLNAPISDDAVNYLIRLSNLKELYLERTRLTPTGIARLKETLPDCKITVKDI